MAARRNEYSEASIRVLKGLEPVRQRPGMYTRTENPLHIVQEALDNAADEALAGFCDEIVVTMHSDGSIEVDDDGRGIPVGKHPEEGVPVVEIVFTRLHAGGKFDKADGGAYSFSGGLHGVGVSVSNALSKRFEVTVWRDGKVHRIAFEGGEVAERLHSKAAGRGDRRSGTAVRMWPDAKYFDSLAIPHGELVHLLRSKAVLLPGVKVTLVEEKAGRRQSWRYEEGLRGYLAESLGQLSDSAPIIPLFEGDQSVPAGHDSFAEGEGAQWVVAWTDEGSCSASRRNRNDTAGGTHDPIARVSSPRCCLQRAARPAPKA